MTSKHTKRGRHARRRAHHLREGWMRAPLRLLNGALVCYVCRAEQPSDGTEAHADGCSVLRLNPPAKEPDALGLLHDRACDDTGPVRGARSARVPREDGAP